MPSQSVYLTLLEVALALRYLHARNIVHRGTARGLWTAGCAREEPWRGCSQGEAPHTVMPYLWYVSVPLPADLKPGNILLKSRSPTPGDPRGFTTKLADFGLALVLDCKQEQEQDAAQGQGQGAQPRQQTAEGASLAAATLSEILGGRTVTPEPETGDGAGADVRYVVQDKACGT
jgi:serine/threonine protein kinase